jgi:hypothetical protein
VSDDDGTDTARGDAGKGTLIGYSGEETVVGSGSDGIFGCISGDKNFDVTHSSNSATAKTE